MSLLSTTEQNLFQMRKIAEGVPTLGRKTVFGIVRTIPQPTKNSISSYANILYKRLNAGGEGHVSHTDVIRLLMSIGLELKFQEIVDNKVSS